MSDLIRKDELETALAARRELGPEYQDEVLDSFLEQVERRLEARLKQQAPGPRRGTNPVIPVGIVSMVMGIPITAIAGYNAGAVGIALAWIGIAIVNLAVAFGGRR